MHLLADCALSPADVLDLIDDGVLVLDPAGALECCNASARRMLGIPELVPAEGTPPVASCRLLSRHGARLPAEQHPWAVALRTRQPGNALVGVDFGAGRVRWLSVRSVIATGADGHGAAHVVSVLSDASAVVEAQAALAERARLQEALLAELEATNVELRDADRVKDVVLATAAHEFVSPLTAIRGFAAVLRQRGDATPEQRAKYLDIVDAEIDRLDVLVRDLLTVCRGHVERERITLSAFRLQPLMERLAMEVPKAELAIQCPRELEIVADEARIGQVLANLVTNAARYAGGRIEVAAATHDETVVLTVRDYGPGVPPEFVPHLFEPFAQGPHADRRGSGLGLAVVHGLVAAHSGTVHYEDAEGGGARFVVRLPQRPSIPRVQELHIDGSTDVVDRPIQVDGGPPQVLAAPGLR